MKKEYCVISHTHWDREWYFTFEQFRFRLVKLIDNLLDIMEKEENFVFHLDAQTIVLEDYLKIKPQNKFLLEKYIKEGRIIVGPWYIQNDFYLTDGEATVRNLLVGTKMANEFGGCGTTGYIPDQFGNISQLPQIYNQFGIKTCLVGRGYSFYHINDDDELERIMTSPEFYWRGKDGSEVFTVRFTTWYNNAQRFSEDVSKNLKLIDHIEAMYQGTDRIPYYLLMNGVDHLEAQENLLEVLPPTNAALEKGVIKQCTMQEFTDKAENYIKENDIDIEEVIGELRYGHDNDLLKGTLSARVYLKTANVKAQNKIENVVEPLYVMAEAMGFKGIYPKDYLEYLWKLLMENHPHDSICGCSIDAVHSNMMDRTARFNEAADELTNDILGVLTAHITREGVKENEYIVTVWNTSEMKISGTATVEFNFPVEEDFENFAVIDEQGREAVFDVIRKDAYCMKTTSPINLPGQIDCDSYLVKLAVDEIEPMSYRTYVVKKIDGKCKVVDEQEVAAKEIKLENDLFMVEVNEMGEISVTDKKQNNTYVNCIRIEDMGEKGNSYIHYDVENDVPIVTDGIKPKNSVLKDTDIEKSCVLRYTLNLPTHLDIETLTRSEEMVENIVEIKLSLIKGKPWIDIECAVDNKAKDHRLRILFDTDMTTDYTTSLIPFDTIERDRREVLKKVSNGTQPNSGLIHIEENGSGIGIMNEGLYEYEHLLNDRGTIAVTLIRSVGMISNLPDRHQRNTMKNIDSQCIGKYTLHLGLTFAKGEADMQVSELVRRTKIFQNGLIGYFQPYSEKKFTGGRPQVQDTDIAELFFREDRYKDISLNKSGKMLNISGDAITVSALKQSEDGELMVLRAYNTSDNAADFKVELSTETEKVYRLAMSEEILKEEAVDDKIVSIRVKPREIVTLGFKLK